MRSARWDKITVPMYSVGNWTGVGLHLRGNIEGFMHAASKHKKLRIHSGTHFHPFHSEEGRLDQLRFFDHWLKGQDTGIMDEPPVKLHDHGPAGDLKDYKFRFENEWPIARTQWTKMYLKLNAEQQNADGKPEGELLPAPVPIASKTTYLASPPTHAGTALQRPRSTQGRIGRTGISLLTAPLTEDTEVTGPMVLVLWVSSSTEDMDIFATIRNIGPDGKDVWEAGQQGWDEVPVAKGWLRVSHRKLDRGALAAIPALSRARRATVACSRARPSNVIWKSGRVAWCSRRGTVSSSTFSRATASAPRSTDTIPPTTTSARRTRSTPAAIASPICCCRSFPRNDR